MEKLSQFPPKPGKATLKNFVTGALFDFVQIIMPFYIITFPFYHIGASILT